MTARRFGLAAAVALVALSASGCQALKEKLAPEPTVVTRKAVVAAADASVDGTLAPGMPEGVPLWPDAEVLSSSKDKQSYNLMLRTRKSYDDVLAGLVTGFEKAGWQVAQEESTDQGLKNAILTVSSDVSQGVVTVADSVESSGAVEIGYVLIR